MAAKVKSISAKELSDEVRKAVAATVAKNSALKATTVDAGIALIPPWIIGLILQASEVKEKTLADAQQAASDVVKSLPGQQRRTPVSFSHGGHVIIGFVEETDVTLLKE